MRSPNASISLFNGFSGFGGTTFSPSHVRGTLVAYPCCCLRNVWLQNSTSRNGNVTFGASSSSMLFPVSTLSSAPTPSGIFSSFDLNRGTRHRRMEPVRESRDNHSYVMHISATSAFVDSQPEMLRAADYKKGDRCGTGYRPTIPVLGESSQSPALFNSVDAAFPPAAPPVYTSGFASNSASGFTFGGGHPFATTQGTSRTFPAPGLTAQASLGQHLQNFPGMDHLPTMCFEHVENMIINFYAGSASSPQRQSISTENISEALPPARTDAQPSGSNPEQSEPTFTLGQSRPSAEQSSSDVSSSRTQPSSNASKAAFTGPQNEQDH